MYGSIKDHSKGHQTDPTLSIQNRLRLTARVALSVSATSTVLLLVGLYLLLGNQSEENYFQIIQSLTRSRDQLALTMLTAGTLAILLAGLVTWMITLYSSHRVAGPLYRFSKNLELEIARGPVATTELRRGDGFQEISSRLGEAADGLSRYYADQLQIIEQLQATMDSPPPNGAERYRELARELARRVDAAS